MIIKGASDRKLNPSVSFKTECNSHPISGHTSNETTPSMNITSSLNRSSKKCNVNERNRSNTPHLKALNTSKFNIPERYTNLTTIGEGSYGIVCMAYDNLRDVNVAIKKITPVSNSCVDSKHVLREMRLLRYLSKHDNIVGLVDMIGDENEDAIYIVMELLDSDLHKLIISPQILNEKHLITFMVQVLRGLSYIHDAGVVHRDIKPANILVTRECHVCLTDFGFARVLKSMINPRESNDLTPHVVTRWYRPPELMLSPKKDYDCSIDIWSVGCTFAELINRKPLFPGSNFMDQLALIFDLIGSPSDDEISHIRGQSAKNFLQSIKHKKRRSLREVLPTASPEAIDLIEKMLVFDPAKRITAKQALMHPFFEGIGREMPCPLPAKQELTFEFDFPGNNIESLRCCLFHEIKDFKCEQACKGIDYYNNEPMGEILNPVFTMEWSPPSACLRVPERHEYVGHHTTKRNAREKSMDEISYFTKCSGPSCKENNAACVNENDCENCRSANSKDSHNENVASKPHMRCRSAAITSKGLQQSSKSNQGTHASPSARFFHAYNEILAAPVQVSEKASNRSIHFRAKSFHFKKHSSQSESVRSPCSSKVKHFFGSMKQSKNITSSSSSSSYSLKPKKKHSENEPELELFEPYCVDGKIYMRIPPKTKHSRTSSLISSLKFPLGQYFNKRWSNKEK